MTGTTMRAWWLEGPGEPEAFRLIERPVPRPDPGSVLVAIEAFGLNRSELFSRRGMSSPDFTFPRVLGLECAGTVLDAPDADLAPGTRVIALMGGMGRAYDGSYATHVVVPRRQVFRAPGDTPAETLGAVPETYNTAVAVCLENVKLFGGERVLVRGATSALGMACIAIAKDLGCTVVGTSRSPDKAALLAARSRIDHAIVDGDDLADRVLETVGPVNVAIECVGSKASIESTCATMVGGGRLGLVGQLAETWDRDARPRIPDGITAAFSRSDLVEAPRDDARMATILDRVATGRWTPNVDTAFPFEALPAAHRAMGDDRAVGKLVVVVGSDTIRE